MIEELKTSPTAVASAIGELLAAQQVRKLVDDRRGGQVFFCLVQYCEVESRVEHQIERNFV